MAARQVEGRAGRHSLGQVGGPSDALRAWFDHEAAKWPEFRTRYFAELDANPDGVAELRKALGRGRRATLLYAAKDEKHNNAVALAEYLGRQR